MNYGSQPSDPWSWGVEDDGSPKNGGMNVQRPPSKSHPPDPQLYNSGVWPAPGQQSGHPYPRPNGSLPQVSAFSQEVDRHPFNAVLHTTISLLALCSSGEWNFARYWAPEGIAGQ